MGKADSLIHTTLSLGSSSSQSVSSFSSLSFCSFTPLLLPLVPLFPFFIFFFFFLLFVFVVVAGVGLVCCSACAPATFLFRRFLLLLSSFISHLWGDAQKNRRRGGGGFSSLCVCVFVAVLSACHTDRQTDRHRQISTNLRVDVPG